MANGGGGDDSREDADSLLRAIAGAPPKTPEATPERIAHFRIDGCLGQGGMGVVYRAWDEKLRRHVALKVLPHALDADDERRKRFLREARSAAAIGHANIAAIFDVGEDAGHVFIAMELVEGETLRSKMAAGPMAPKEAVRIARGIARGLARAHGKGVVHRDLKPENVMLDAEGEPKILDFGLAKIDAGAEGLAMADTVSLLTEEGRLLGTPMYMSPEQVVGDPADVRTDVFSLGVMLYEMLAGKRPFGGDTARYVLLAIARDEPEPLRKVVPELPESLGAIVDRCLRKAKDERYASAREVLEALDALPSLAGIPASSESSPRGAEQVLSTRMTVGGRIRPPAPARRRRPLLLAVFALVAVAGIGTVAWRSRVSGANAPVVSSTAAASPPARGTAITDEPPPKTTSGEAMATYAAALQALHDGAVSAAGPMFVKATKLDPSFAAAHLRNLLYWHPWGRDDRASYAAAVQNRASLSDRDRELLNVVEALVLPETPDRAEAARRAQRAAERWPNDAEVAVVAAKCLVDAGDLDGAFAAFDRALTLDPTFAFAVHEHAAAQIASGDLDGGLSTASHCLELSPVAAACARRRAEVFAARGQCGDFEREARRGVAAEPHSANAQRYVIAALAARRAPIEALRDAVSTMLAAPEEADEHAVASQISEAGLALYSGDLGEAIARDLEAVRLARQKDPSSLDVSPVVLLEEAGQREKAAAQAQDFLRRAAGSSTGKAGRSDALAELHLAARMRDEEFLHDRDLWADEQRSSSMPWADTTWVDFYARTAATPAEARDAIAVQSRFPPTSRGVLDLGDYAVREEGVGRVYLLAGALDEAIPHLRAAAGSCGVIEAFPFWLHAHEELGEALAAKGDTAGACEALAVVLSYWGHATPRSVTADKARAQAKKLGCP